MKASTKGVRLLVVITAVLFTLPATSQKAAAQGIEAQLAFSHAQHLRRGVNVSNWFAQQPGNYGVERLRTFTTADDLKLIHEMGFDHVRLSVDADPLLVWNRGRPEGTDFITEMDRVVHTANADGLAVVIDVHPQSGFKQTLFSGTEAVEQFASLWRALAEHYKATDPNLVFFEIMNEPEQQDAFRWQGIEAEITGVIHAVAPKHTVIAGGAHWSGLEDLLQFEPLADQNVIYTFHDYEPFPFTHQGATWTDARVVPLRNVPYPSTPDNVAPNEAQEHDPRGKLFVEQYGLDHWDAERVGRTLAFAAAWGTAHHVPVYCGEFGVHRPYAPAQARAAWLHDMRVSLEENQIGWAVWDYQDNFGLVTKSQGSVAVPDAAAVVALGLKPVR